MRLQAASVGATALALFLLLFASGTIDGLIVSASYGLATIAALACGCFLLCMAWAVIVRREPIDWLPPDPDPFMRWVGRGFAAMAASSLMMIAALLVYGLVM